MTISSILNYYKDSYSPISCPKDKICSDNEELVIVFDNFKRTTVDVNGNALPDSFHRNLVASTIFSELKENTDIWTDDLTIGSHNYAFSKLKDSLPYIKSKSVYINFSNDMNGEILTLKELEELTGLDIQEDMSSYESKYLSLRAQRETIIKKLKENKNLPEEKKRALRILEMIDEIVKEAKKLGKEIKIYAAADNDPKEINLLGLSPHVTLVGALDADNNIADYSANNSLVSRWENGDINFKQTKANPNIYSSPEIGIILTEDFTIYEDDLQKTYKKILVSKIIKKGSLKYKFLKILKDRKWTSEEVFSFVLGKGKSALFLIDDVKGLFLNEKIAEDLKKYGTYISINSYSFGFNYMEVFDINKRGELISTRQVNYRKDFTKVEGTSFASPGALAEDL